MPIMNLSARFVDGLKPAAAGQIDYRDEALPGFGIRVSPGGRKAWVVVYRHNGRLRRLTLGVHPHMSLAEACGKARDDLHHASNGGDPATAKQKERRVETFADLAKEHIERHASKKRSGREDVRLLNGSPHKKRTGKTPHVPLVTRWGSRKLSDIKRRDVRDLLEEIAERAPILTRSFGTRSSSSLVVATSGSHRDSVQTAGSSGPGSRNPCPPTRSRSTQACSYCGRRLRRR